MSGLYDEQVIHDNIYANTYSLWGNSKYYDIKNLSPQNFANRNGTIGSEISQEFKARWTTYPAEAPKAPEPPDRLNRRTVHRDSLYEDPDTFKKDHTPDIPQDTQTTSLLSEDGPVSKSPTFDWTQFYWHKASEIYTDGGQGPSRGRKRPVLGANNVQRKLDIMLAKPVKMTKAESMMQKMGWQGGALGRSGDGIMEPIAPNAVYVANNATTKIGFGQNHIQTQPQRGHSPKNIRNAECKHIYDMNVLLNIYEFVKSNNEVELLFDKNLNKDERKRIHYLVQFKLSAEDMAAVDFNNSAQMDLALQICDKNCYVLHTQSYGSYPVRQLSLFKVAPPHVYLITPDKLKDHRDSLFSDEFRQQFLSVKNGEEFLEVEVEQEPPVPEEPKVPEELEPEEETNPFLISITRNLKKKSDSECQEEEVVPEEKVVPVVIQKPEVLPEMSAITTKIVKYFTEFAECKRFSQFKFLGPFSEEEIVAINEFIEDAVKYVSLEPCLFACVFKKVAFEINEDCTGNTVIYKRPTERKNHRKN